MKILVSAYACEPGRGSEGEIGWRMVLHLARRHEVWVITRANLEPVHEQAFKEIDRPEKLHFVYFDLPWVLRWYKRGRRFFLLYYYLWQLGVAVQAWKLRSKKFDVLHHLIGGMDWMPSGLAVCPGNFVWGPVGSEDTHPVMRARLPVRSKILDGFRVAARGLMRTLDPFVRLTGARAKIVLSHTPGTMPRRYAPRLRLFTQTGIENGPALASAKADLARGATLRLLFAGELREWKGANLALQAALRFFEDAPQATLRIVGDGPLRKEMELRVRSHAQGHRVTLVGHVPMAELVRELREADVFVYPSFHHGMATVVLQAMLTGLPVVCIEGDAIARTVGDRAGISVPLSRDRDPVQDVAAALGELANDEPRRRRLATSAREIAIREFDYERLSKQLEDVYEEVSARPERRPRAARTDDQASPAQATATEAPRALNGGELS
jgi:glycosyltransferase involved in cell wall biosynthesis